MMRDALHDQRFALRLPPGMLAWLRQEARKQETTASELIRRTIDEQRKKKV